MDHHYNNTTPYDGSGIDIGILESGFIDDGAKELSNTSITYHSFLSTKVTPHATIVASIIAGDEGIVPGAHLYSSRVANSSLLGWENSFTWFLVTNNVDVVNISGGFDTNGIYSTLDEYLDYVITNYDTPVVKSAGNEGDGNGYITSPGLAYNIITVGALENRTTLADYSSTDELSSSNIEKPSIVALGTYKIRTSFFSTEYVSGTSFAAPAVTRTIAAMMDRYASIKNLPFAVHAVLSSNADMTYLTSYNDITNGYENSVGAGELNVYDSIMGVTKYSAGGIDEPATPGLLQLWLMDLDAYDKITVTLWWEVNSLQDGSTYNIKDIYDLDLFIYHPQDGLYCQSTSSNYNFEKFTCQVFATANYELVSTKEGYFDSSIHGPYVKFAYAWKIE
jgi:hypothetical protein